MPGDLVRTWRSRVNSLVAGITWPVVIVTLLLCAYRTLTVLTYRLFAPNVTLASWLIEIAWEFATTLVAAIPILLCVNAVLNRGANTGRQLLFAIAGAVLIGTALGMALKVPIDLVIFDELRYLPTGWLLVDTFQAYVGVATIGGLFAAAYALNRNEVRRMAILHEAEIERAVHERAADEARLHALQAQIEPHFLFNTLANVRRLYDVEPEAADRMLDNLMRYLSAALPEMRSHDSTLGRETTLAVAYLDIQRIRMGDRLRYDIDVPESLRTAPIPPMMLLTLVENAVKHGVGPLPEGGEIRIRATGQGDRLAVEVTDSGRGFGLSWGSGTGIANIRGQLKAMHGSNAQLTIATRQPSGAIVTIDLPRAATA
jgi:signal transduction histidine kinase